MTIKKKMIRNRKKIMSTLYALEMMLMGGLGALLVFFWTFTCIYEHAYENYGAGLPITGSSLANFLIITGYELLFVMGIIVTIVIMNLVKKKIFIPFNKKLNIILLFKTFLKQSHHFFGSPSGCSRFAQAGRHVVVTGEHLPAVFPIIKDAPEFRAYLLHRHGVGNQFFHNFRSAMRFTREIYFTFKTCRFRKTITFPIGV